MNNVYVLLIDNKTKAMAYHSKNSSVYHKYKRCTVGNNIEKDNLKSGTGGKTLCQTCKEIEAGTRSR